MFFFHMLPSWDEIQRRLDRDMGYQTGDHFRNHLNEPTPSRSLIIRRFDCVRRAFILAEWEAGRILVQRFSDLDISSIIKDLIDVVAQMAMIVVGSAFTGGLIGAGVGSIFFGVGAYPGGALGAALGLQASTFILGVLGLKSIAEYVVDGFPRIVGYYLSGIKTAWQGPREQGLNPFMNDDPYAQNNATQDIAKGHVEVVLLLLGAVVEYLTRGRGDARLLAQEMRASPKGERLGQWMLEHEDALKKRPDLQRPEPGRSPFDNQHFSDNPVVNRSETKNITDLNAQASQSVGKVTAPIDFDGHVLSAEVKPNGNVIGGHSIATGDVQIIPGTASAPNAQGVYSARIRVADPQNPGSFLPKTNNGGISTLFPDSWTPDRIKVEVDGAFQNKTIVGNKWTGTTPSGVRVEGYLNPKTTVYPKL